MEKNYLDFLEFYAACYAERIYKRYPSISAALNSDTPFLREIKKVHNDSCLEHFIQMWIQYVVDRIKVKTNPDESDLELVKATICQDYQHFKISEVALIFIEMATGKYGTFYQALTPVYILRCFRDYDAKRKKIIPEDITSKFFTTNTRSAFIVNGLFENGHLKNYGRSL